MAKKLRMAAELSRDSITFNPTFDVKNYGLIPVAPGYTLPGSLTIQLANRCNEVELEGQATFIFTAATDMSTADTFGVQIDIYANGGVLPVYTIQSILTGLSIAPISNYIWTVPIRFEENPALTVVQDTVVYTAIITRIGTATANGTIVVVQGSIEAEEVSSDFNCFPPCGAFPRTQV